MMMMMMMYVTAKQAVSMSKTPDNFDLKITAGTQ